MLSLGRYFRTIRYIKPVQAYYRLRYIILPGRKRIKIPEKYSINISRNSYSISPPALSPISYKNGNIFEFLNLQKKFKDRIDWNFDGYGKLWNYNLNYFDYLHQPGMNVDEGIYLIEDYCRNIPDIKNGLKPYPLSLRCFNWIKFLINNQIDDDFINRCLWAQFSLLKNNLEYHLLANHILENGFALLYGSLYFDDKRLYNDAKRILTRELEEQILSDGGHFELSPMYHQIVLGRLLDCINLIGSEPTIADDLLRLMQNKTAYMIGWLRHITFNDGNIPLLNDSARGIAPHTNRLIKYAENLEINKIDVDLGDSGYRKISGEKFECVIDVGHIGPDYQPGHAHADTFTFELYVDNKPYIVDCGTSTYEPGERRSIERGTGAHNTVLCHNENSSEVWSSHRVGRRAYVTVEEERTGYIKATHNGYKHKGTFHTRSFEFHGNQMFITDTITEKNKAIEHEAFLHFHPDITLHIEDLKVTSNIKVGINFTGANAIHVIPYEYAPEFNSLIRAQCLRITFTHRLKTIIEF